jgi:ferredoxin
MGKYVITKECINCGACAACCPVGAIEPKGKKHEIDDKCIQCGSCMGICPVDAIAEGE